MRKKDALSDVFVRTVKAPGKHVDGKGLFICWSRWLLMA